MPKTYILKVTKKLENAGIVKIYQGINGGVATSKSADSITLWDIIEATESTTMINKCLEKGSCCYGNHSSDCSVKKIYMHLQKAIEERLQSISLNDILLDVAREEIFSRELEVDKILKQ